MEAKEIIAIWKKHGVEVLPSFIEVRICEEIAEISFKAGQEEEHTKWIKFFKQNGIKIEQPQQLNRIIPCLKSDFQKAGVSEVVLAVNSYIARHGTRPKMFEWWQAQKKKWGIER